MTAHNKPAIKLTGDDTGKWKIELRNFPELDKTLGRDVLNAFCRCFVHLDRLTSITSCTYASEQYHGRDSTAYSRDHMSMVRFAIGTLRELARAIRHARSALAKRQWLQPESEHWAILRKIENRWENDEFFRKKRDVAAFHIDVEVIDKGLNELVKCRIVNLEEGQGERNVHSTLSLGTLALFNGLEMNLVEYGAFIAKVTNDEVAVRDAINIAFLQAAEVAGVSHA